LYQGGELPLILGNSIQAQQVSVRRHIHDKVSASIMLRIGRTESTDDSQFRELGCALLLPSTSRIRLEEAVDEVEQVSATKK
jgi:hypothetical protein